MSSFASTPRSTRFTNRFLILAALLAVMVAVTPALAAPAVAAPLLKLSASSGAPGTPLGISGSGYAKLADGYVLFGGTRLVSFQTSTRGTFSVSTTVPTTASGTVTVTGAVGFGSASASFTVISPAPAPEPEPAPDALVAPRRVLGVQGPSAAGSLYVVVTWDRSAAGAVGYEVSRDGGALGSVQVVGDAWDDLVFHDRAVVAGGRYEYRVRARFADGSWSGWSLPAGVVVRSDAQLGSGRVFVVDEFGGGDRARLQAAVDAAVDAGGGVVQLAARTYVLDAPVEVPPVDDVVLRGAGMDRTFVQPGFAGESVTCGSGGRLIGFTGKPTVLSARLTAPVAVGDRVLRVDSTSGLVVGRRLVLFEPTSVSDGSPADYEAAGVVQDPGTGRDERHRWDASEIVAVDAGAKTVTLKDALSQSFTTAVPLVWLEKGNGNGLELLTVQGRSAGESTHYRLVDLNSQAGFRMAEVQGRWANRNYVRANGYDIQVVGFRGPLGDPGGTDGTCKYKFSVWRSANFTFVSGVMGEPSHSQNTSFITTQRAQRTLVRNSTFWGNRTYAFNEHGLGSRHYVFENNYVAVGALAKAGVFLGNSSRGFAGAGIIRNNTFSGNGRDIVMQENSYEVRVLDNVMRGTTDRVISGYSWAAPFTAPTVHGSLRWTIAGNRVEGGKGDGIVFGEPTSPWYPYQGVKDVVITGNALDVAGTAIRLDGTSSTTNRLQVAHNTGSNRYLKPTLTTGSYWTGNADNTSYGTPTSVTWTRPYFP